MLLFVSWCYLNEIMMICPLILWLFSPTNSVSAHKALRIHIISLHNAFLLMTFSVFWNNI